MNRFLQNKSFYFENHRRELSLSIVLQKISALNIYVNITDNFGLSVGQNGVSMQRGIATLLSIGASAFHRHWTGDNVADGKLGLPV